MATGSDGKEEKRIPLFDLKTPKRYLWKTVGKIVGLCILAPVISGILTGPVTQTYEAAQRYGIYVAVVIYGEYAILLAVIGYLIVRLLRRLRGTSVSPLLVGIVLVPFTLVLLCVVFFISAFLTVGAYMT